MICGLRALPYLAYTMNILNITRSSVRTMCAMDKNGQRYIRIPYIVCLFIFFCRDHSSNYVGCDVHYWERYFIEKIYYLHTVDKYVCVVDEQI